MDYTIAAPIAAAIKAVPMHTVACLLSTLLDRALPN
jgi:hypothetical protein